jgi:ADP-ribose pyrophosphatase YjhB (NUDIX family)
MYKVFIENRAVFILDNEEINSLEGIIIKTKKLKGLRKLIFNCFSDTNINLPLYVIHPNPEKAFLKIFKKYEFVEAAGGIVKKNNNYLFIKRNGFWDIPKGKLDENENPELGAIREIEEECGISKPSITNFNCITYHTYLYNGKPTIKKTYWYNLNYSGKGKLTPQLEEGITEVKWLSKKEINQIIMNTYPSIKDVISNYFKDDSFLV